MPGLEIAYITSIYPVICLPSQNSVLWLHLTVGVAQKWGLSRIPRSEYRCLALISLKKTPLSLQPKTLIIMNLSCFLQFLFMLLASSTYSFLLVFTKLWKLWDRTQLQNLKLMKWVKLFLLFRETFISNMYWSLFISCFEHYYSQF